MKFALLGKRDGEALQIQACDRTPITVVSPEWVGELEGTCFAEAVAEVCISKMSNFRYSHI
jgi:hypothetical protein